MSQLDQSLGACIARIRAILTSARRAALQTVNSTMLTAYWHVGREIVEEEQLGQKRAGYGKQLLQGLSVRLTSEFGAGFSVANLKLIRQFYVVYVDRRPAIGYTGSTQLLPPPQGPAPLQEIGYTLCSQSEAVQQPVGSSFRPELSWSHYRVLMRVARPEARSFYEVECAKGRWAVRQLERQIGSMLYERLARSRDKAGVLALAQEGHEVHRPEDLVKDPYVLEFAGLPEAARWTEAALETALIDRLQHFLLELGRDLFFVARQKRITIDGDHYYVDLVFYHRVLRCFLLIDLKNGRLTQQDIGQMLLYTGYYEAENKRTDENPPIGLVLCTSKSDAAVKYTLSRSVQKVFASTYQFHLPTEQELVEELQRELFELGQGQLEPEPEPTAPENP